MTLLDKKLKFGIGEIVQNNKKYVAVLSALGGAALRNYNVRVKQNGKTAGLK